ncbi:hypothetical protein [Aurantibacter aestuarii]|uniref:Uncharacterized protein n=1 Tax=Aurantibacter aestuarii TaxID=1266046 RepID=A0A2T1N5K7_9FLAO|nr:hypothetical protein [Aurantibacter aestuarii]PSG86572.1 hypothetical protein C7H52_12890 [Aurantibacter aestuarii]
MENTTHTPVLDFCLNIFYQRVRLSDKKIIYPIREDINTSNLGLYILAIHPELEFGNHNYSDNIKWLQLVQTSLFLIIAGKLLKGEIELYKYNDKEYFLLGLFKRTIENYYLKPIKLTSSNNTFENNINETLNYCKKRYQQDNNLNKFINTFFSKYLNNYSVKYPAKTFWKLNLKKLSHENKTVNLIESEALFGIYKKYNLNISDAILNDIIENQYKIKQAFFNDNQSSHFNPTVFSQKLSSIIEKDLNNRI